VSSCIREEDKKVVHKIDKASFSDHVTEGVIHESLEDERRVGEPEEHDGGFEETFMGDESSLPLVAIFVVDIIIPLIKHQT